MIVRLYPGLVIYISHLFVHVKCYLSSRVHQYIDQHDTPLIGLINVWPNYFNFSIHY